MTWKDQDDLQKKAKDRSYVSCEERYELDSYIERYGEDAVERCCQKIKPPRPRQAFEQCLQRNGKERTPMFAALYQKPAGLKRKVSQVKQFRIATTLMGCLMSLGASWAADHDIAAQMLRDRCAQTLGLPSERLRLPQTQALESLKARFDECDRNNRYAGFELGHGYHHCRQDPNRVAYLARAQASDQAVVVWSSKLAVNLDGSWVACHDPGKTDACGTAYPVPRSATDATQVSLDSDTVRYLTLPAAASKSAPQGLRKLSGEFASQTGIQGRDVALVFRGETMTTAIIGDRGPMSKLGEGSMALHRALGVEWCARRNQVGTCVAVRRPLSSIQRDVITVAFPASKPAGLNAQDINEQVQSEAMRRWRAFCSALEETAQ